MKEEPKVPISMDDDPAVDSWLGGLERFSPRRGFEDRVVGLVRVPLPRWLRGLRDRMQALTSGVTGWTILATFSLATAAAWGLTAAAGIRYHGVVLDDAGISLRDVTNGTRQEITDYVLAPAGEAWAAFRAWLASSGVPVRGLLIGYGIVILVSVIALWRLMAEPARVKGATDAVQ